MIIALQRTAGTSSMSMIVDEDWGWGCLKRAMCEKWEVEEAFDRRYVWERLRHSQVVLFQGDFYQVWDTVTQGEYADELFQGRHIEIFDEVIDAEEN